MSLSGWDSTWRLTESIEIRLRQSAKFTNSWEIGWLNWYWEMRNLQECNWLLRFQHLDLQILLQRSFMFLTAVAEADLGGGCRGCAPPPPHDDEALFNIQLFRERLSNKTVRDNAERQYGECGFMVFDWGFRCFSDIEGNSTNKCIYACSFLVGKDLEPQSINAKTLSSHNPIGIVAYAFTLL